MMIVERKPLKPQTVIGRLTVIGLDVETSEKRKKPYYFCQCSCGSSIKSYAKSSLVKKNPTQSCGCIRKEIISQLHETKPIEPGTIFGRLTVIGKDEEKSLQKKKPFYWVQCSCGSAPKSILKMTLTDKRHPVQSCGCLVREKAGFDEDREIAIKKLLYEKMKDRHINTLNQPANKKSRLK